MGRDALDFVARQVTALNDYTNDGVDSAQLGLRALLAGSLVNLANAAIAGVVAA